MDISTFEIDKEAIEEGVWKDIGVGNIRIRFRSPQSETVQKIRRRIEAPFRSKIRKDSLSLEEKAKIFFETMIQGGVLDWENIEDKNGPIAWSIENGRKILDPGNYKDIGDAAVNAFLDLDGFLRDQDEDGRKNSSTVSAGRQSSKVTNLA